jgi:IclR family transcriptional regulator, pca regulon regulatory protein
MPTKKLKEKSPEEEAQPFVTAFARGLAVIRAFGPQLPHPTLAELAKATNLPRASVRRSLHTLLTLGYAQTNGRFFSLTPKILGIGYSYLSTTSLPRVAQPFLERVSDRTSESCSLCVLEEDEIVYVARAATRRIMSVVLSVGSRLPAYCTSMGRVLMGDLPEQEMKERLKQAKLQRHTTKTIIETGALLQSFRLASKQGFAIVDQELEIGLRSIAVPVYGPGRKVVASMNVSAQAGRVNLEEMRGAILDTLREAAADLSTALGA